MAPSDDTGALGGDLTVEKRLRLNATAICRQTGDGWREEVAGLMGCGVDDVGAGPVSRHRDSDPLDQSNFRVILRNLQSVDSRVRAERFRHWGFGWVEEIVVPLDNPTVSRQVEGWVSALQDYAVADDLDYAELEADYAANSVATDDYDDGVDAVGADLNADLPRLTFDAALMRRRLGNLSLPADEPPSL
jgi:hypothetical protein